ncbi:ArsC/Spx/MgsR family protein [Croceicoccus sp. F390]|uniref:ArsC/Spx/MgsR family protein n=1 Tax=Croceicoccus esteveae TaxID=3075597 RepID=A0ABU2ZHE6_9SPHN|nr:ArsC/Spx/MgsR family protein [Croceicoccus sp. F390]MDT0575776.1 ArsC/Spx/MgsR family protein [Croceicoccus sp. F390]
MKATIWHNAACGKSRAALAMLQDIPEIRLQIVDYLANPPTAEQLRKLYQDAGITPQQGLRLRATDAEERGLLHADDDTVLEAMAAQPSLIERPLVETEKGVRLCRPVEKLQEIL